MDVASLALFWLHDPLTFLPVFEREAATWYGGGLSGSGYGALLTQDL